MTLKLTLRGVAIKAARRAAGLPTGLRHRHMDRDRELAVSRLCALSLPGLDHVVDEAVLEEADHDLLHRIHARTSKATLTVAARQWLGWAVAEMAEGWSAAALGHGAVPMWPLASLLAWLAAHPDHFGRVVAGVGELREPTSDEYEAAAEVSGPYIMPDDKTLPLILAVQAWLVEVEAALLAAAVEQEG